jgi:hypothetical protein
MHGYGYGYCYTPTTTPVKHNAGGGTIYRTPPINVFPKRAKTEDFLTFLCLRGINIILFKFVCLFDGVKHHFQQYFSYIVAVSFIGGGNGGPGENHRPVASH